MWKTRPDPVIAGGRTSAAGLLAVAIMVLAGCSDPTPDEEIIRGHLDYMAEALEEQNARRFMEPLAEDFTATTRDLDRRAARLLLRREMVARERIRARTSGLEIQFHGEDRATARFRAVLTGGSGIIPDDGRRYRVETGWRRAGGDWELISAEWE